MLCILLSVLPCLQSQETIEKLVDKFRSDWVEQREEAYFGLKALGVLVQPIVEDLARDQDFEVAFRASELLPFLEVRGWIDPRFLALFPRLARRIAVDDDFARFLLSSMPRLAESFEWDEGWGLKVFFYAETLVHLCPNEVSVEDLEPLAASAFKEIAEDDEALRLCGIAESYDLRSVVPEIRHLLNHRNPALREGAVTALARLGGKEAVRDLIPFLDDPEEAVREQVFYEIKWTDVEGVVRPLLAFLEGQVSPAGAVKALVLLGVAGREEALSTVRKRLQDTDADVRRQAMRSLLVLVENGCTPDLKDALENPDETIRLMALRCIRDMGLKNASSGVLRRLEDTSVRVRQEALITLSRIGTHSLSSVIAPLLKETPLRQTAIYALGALGSKEFIHEIRKYVWDQDPYVRAQATLVIRALEGPRKPAKKTLWKRVAR